MTTKNNEHGSKPDTFDCVDLDSFTLKVGLRVMTLHDIDQVPAGAIGRIILAGEKVTVEWERVGHVVEGEPWIATKTVFNKEEMQHLAIETHNE